MHVLANISNSRKLPPPIPAYLQQQNTPLHRRRFPTFQKDMCFSIWWIAIITILNHILSNNKSSSAPSYADYQLQSSTYKKNKKVKMCWCISCMSWESWMCFVLTLFELPQGFQSKPVASSTLTNESRNDLSNGGGTIPQIKKRLPFFRVAKKSVLDILLAIPLNGIHYFD